VAGLEDRPFALTVGDLSPRKNVEVLLDVWPAVHSATGLVLVIVGGAGWRSTATQRRVEELAGTGAVRWLRDLPDAELRWCYEHAVMALIPTFDEGYGIPVIESVAFGCTVLASTAPALVEVAHGHAQHVPAHSATAWRDAIVANAEMPRRAPVHLGLPSWDEHAARTVATYEDACALSRRRGPEHP
jgi:glycosyltransferase involved in cell wall biosynthesis